MREIKFRAWDKKQNAFVDSFWDDYIEPAIDRKEFELMQFTGLHDKNGKEIYEGDIVKYDESEKINHWVAGETTVVIWVAPRFTFRMKPYDEFNGSNQNMPNEDDGEFLEVIGNIYENENLITNNPKG